MGVLEYALFENGKRVERLRSGGEEFEPFDEDGEGDGDGEGEGDLVFESEKNPGLEIEAPLEHTNALVASRGYDLVLL